MMNFIRSLPVLLCLASTAAFGQIHDVAWTFGNVGFSAYRLDAFTPAGANLGVLGVQNPVLALELGKRYEVRITDFGSHPFEVIAKAASASQDRVLLSMGSPAGTLESDPGQGVVRFTRTFSLHQAMTAEGRTPG